MGQQQNLSNFSFELLEKAINIALIIEFKFDKFI